MVNVRLLRKALLNIEGDTPVRMCVTTEHGEMLYIVVSTELAEQDDGATFVLHAEED